jgi:multiple sugar transport system permease protein
LKQDRNIFDPNANPFWFNLPPTWKHYWDLINPNKTDFFIWMQNSFMVAGLVTVISVTIGIMAGYSLARLRFKGAETIGSSVFITYLVPPSLLFLPLSHVIDQLGLMETRWAMIVSYPTFLVPFCTWLLMGYFRTIPREVEECALVDGATRMQTLTKIVLPMAVPGIVCAILFSFTLCWNEFTYALTFVSQTANKTAVVGVTADLIRGDIYYWGSLMAGAILASVPIVIVYVLFLDYYVSGLTAGAVKG